MTTRGLNNIHTVLEMEKVNAVNYHRFYIWYLECLATLSNINLKRWALELFSRYLAHSEETKLKRDNAKYKTVE